MITEADQAAIALLHEAMALAQAGGETAQNILVALAARHYQKGELDLAKRYASEWQEQALANEDWEAADEAARFLEGAAQHDFD